ncbi:helix-turn-helix transcriptional regulator [Ornithinibacillus halotolerans]|uniref:HTH luxR-type domain-containing protein n=1 Tax=Ornithinibacillus halotolerans TaxID=1274357 RepID=A0A916W4J0_9BACI|nr:LuxR C-terminal-related transcriptional regulator [Ornithinibacillus halotolerans]GGA65091.1 hypothetical protein GCM10008025_06120 [Ornithinibacillus halotolerans]
MRICLLQDSKFFLLVREFFSRMDGFHIVTSLPADFVLIDDENITMDEVIHIIHSVEHEKTVLFTDKQNEHPVTDLLDTGVASILYKEDIQTDSLPNILERINNNEFFLPPAMTKSFLNRTIKMMRVAHDRFIQRVQERDLNFTMRQAEVASLMKINYPNKEIARIVGISEGSVKVHVSDVYKKLGTNDRTEAMKKLLEINIYEKE